MTLEVKLEELRNRGVESPHYFALFCHVKITRGFLSGMTGKVTQIRFDGTAWVWLDLPFQHPEGGARFNALGATSALEVIGPPDRFSFIRTKQKTQALPVETGVW